MLFGLGRKASQIPVNLASVPGYAVAVQLVSEHGTGKPRLALAQVLESNAPASEKLDQMVRRIKHSRGPLRVLLESAEYQMLQTDFPAVPQEELKTAVRWQIKDMLRLPLAEVTLDVLPPPESGQNLRRPAGFVVAAANKLVLERMQQFRFCNSEVRVIDVPEMAQRNLADLLEESGHATVVLSINQSGCLLTLSRAGTLYFTRSFELSTLTLNESESVRRDQFDRLLLELQRSIDMIEHQFSFLSTSALWLAPFAYRDELLSVLIENLYLPVKPIELNAVFDCGQCSLPIKLDQQAAMFHGMGLALRDRGLVP